MAQVKGRSSGSGKKKSTKKTVTKTTSGPSAVSQVGPAPGIPKLPKVDIDLGIGKIATDLAKARKQGKSAAKGQLASIDERMQATGVKQSNKYDQKTDKIMRGMKRLDRQSRLFTANQQAGVNATNQNIMRNATPGRGGNAGALGVGITGNREALLRNQGKAITATTRAGLQAGRTMERAGQRAVDATPRIEAGASKNAMSILDVLAAERKTDDVRFLAELRQQEKQLELSQAHDMRMAQMNFQNDLYMQKYSTALQKDYQSWQYDQGYLETPDQQRAEEFKYWKMEQDYVNKIEQKKDKDGSYRAWSKGIDVAESAVASAATIMNAPGYNNKIKAMREADPTLTPEAAGAKVIEANMRYTPPEGDVAATNIATNIAWQMAASGTTPTFEDVQGIVSASDDLAAKYVNKGNPERIKRIHQNYRALNAAVLGTEQYKAVASVPEEGIVAGRDTNTDASVLPAGTVPFAGGPDATPPPTGDEATDGGEGANYLPGAAVAAATLGGVAAVRAAKGRAALTPGMTTGQAFRTGAVEGLESIRGADFSVNAASQKVEEARQGLARVIKGVNRDKISRGVVSAFQRPNAADEIAREMGYGDQVEDAFPGSTQRTLDTGRNLKGVDDLRPVAVSTNAAEEALPARQGRLLTVDDLPNRYSDADVDAIDERRVARQREIRAVEDAATPPRPTNPEVRSPDDLRFEGEGDNVVKRVLTSPAAKAALRTAGKALPIAGAAVEGVVIADQVADIVRGRVEVDENTFHKTSQMFLKVARDQLFTGDMDPAEYHDMIRNLSIDRPDEWAGNLSDDEKWEMYQYGVRSLHEYYSQQRGK